MTPAELCRLLYQFRNPRYIGVGISARNDINQIRHESGLEPHGTIWWATGNGREWTLVVPRYEIPYRSIHTAKWNEDRRRWEGGLLLRGWHEVLRWHLSRGYLLPSRRLSWYLGKDTFVHRG